MYQVMIATEQKSRYQQMRHILSQIGISVRILPCAYDMASFVRTISGTVPDLLITDVEIPRLSQLETAEYVQYKKYSTKVVVLTEEQSVSFLQKALRLGVADYILLEEGEPAILNRVRSVLISLEEEAQNQEIRGNRGAVHLKFLRLAEKELMQSILLGVPDEAVLAELMEPKPYIYTIMAVDGYFAPSAEVQQEMQFQRTIFLPDICICFPFQKMLYLLIAQENADQNRLCEQAKEMIWQSQQDAVPLRIGISEPMTNPSEFPQGLAQAKEAVNRLGKTGIGLYQQEIVVISQQEERYVSNAVAYMQGHYMKKLTLEEVAQQVGISKYYLSRLFQKVEQKGFSDLLTQIRIDHALKLLGDGNRSVQEISHLCGYPSVNYFYKVIKRQSGITVKHVQKMLLEQKGRDKEHET